jgi:CRP-like cAMP-binding protein
MQEQLGRLMVSSPIGVWDAPASARVIERETVALLEQVPLFAGLSRRHLGRVASVAAPKHYLAGATLVRVGAPADAFYIILDGAARVEIPVGTVALEPGDFFGEMALIDGEPRAATVTAATDMVVLVIPRPKFLALLMAEPKVALAMMTTLVQRLRAAQAKPVAAG